MIEAPRFNDLKRAVGTLGDVRPLYFRMKSNAKRVHEISDLLQGLASGLASRFKLSPSGTTLLKRRVIDFTPTGLALFLDNVISLIKAAGIDSLEGPPKSGSLFVPATFEVQAGDPKSKNFL